MTSKTRFTWIAGLMAGAFLFLSGPAAAQDGNIGLQMQRLRRDLSDLQSYVYAGKTPPKQSSSDAAPSQGGEIQSVSRMQVQLQNIESQMRELTGRAEEMEHRITALQERLEKFISDSDQRFRALESGEPGAIGTAAPGRQSSRGSASIAGIGEAAAATPRSASGGPKVLGTLSSKNVGGAARSAKTGRQVAALPKGTPKEQYDHAFGLLKKRRYAEASVAFKAFVDAHPDAALAGNALYWLGESHYIQKDYAEAARIFLEGFKRFPKGNKAPANLFKLGKSLAAINEKKPACAALRKLRKTFPKTNKQLLQQAKTAMGQIGCS
jgi:tol-pal system protein YbgF